MIKWIKDFFGLLYPNYCQICGRSLSRGESICCVRCIAELPYTEFWRYDDNPVAHRFWGQVEIEAACSLLYFRKGSGIRHLVHLLKYRSETRIGYKLGYLLGLYLKQEPSYQSVDVVVPVPLHAQRLRARGYNQSDYIADGVADAMGITKNTSMVIRRKATASQTRKNRHERYSNVESIFSVPNPDMALGKHVLLVDDVITTGATVGECAKALLQAASCRVSIASLGTV